MTAISDYEILKKRRSIDANVFHWLGENRILCFLFFLLNIESLHDGALIFVVVPLFFP